jgi:YVTN family beta-propeller protein
MSDLPRGTISLLFTDIEGSTQLQHRLRERYRDVVAEHRRLLEEAIESNSGRVVDRQTESFFAVFPRMRDAVTAAAAAQRGMAGHEWPDGAHVKVRMGIHAGEPVLDGDRYVGLAVSRAARVAGTAHGGQVVLSGAARGLLSDEHVRVRSLGSYPLKDFDAPEPLFQLEIDGLPDRFPPPKVAATRERRSLLLAIVGVAVVVALLAAGGVLLASRDAGGGGLEAVRANHVGVIDPQTNEIVDEIPVGIRPGPIAAGAGAVWVGNVQDRTLQRIDPGERTATPGTISLENRTPTGIAVGLDAVWVAHGLRGEVSRVDPQFGRVTGTTPVAGTAFGSPNGSVAVGSGSVWAVFGDSTLARLDAEGQLLGSTLAGLQPAGVVAPGNSVWVTNAGDSTVQRYNARTFREAPLRTFNLGTQPTGIIYADDAIWVASSGDATVLRIEPDSGATRSIDVGEGPTALASVPGSVWVANTASRTVSRIDTSTSEVVATIEIGDAPSGIAAADGLLWVSVRTP